MSEEEREYLNEMIRSLNNQLVDALRERDEARREVCRLDSIWHAEHGNFQVEKFGPKALAEQRGWDCFKESN